MSKYITTVSTELNNNPIYYLFLVPHLLRLGRMPMTIKIDINEHLVLIYCFWYKMRKSFYKNTFSKNTFSKKAFSKNTIL